MSKTRPTSAYNGKVSYEFSNAAAETIGETYGTATRMRKSSGYEFASPEPYRNRSREHSVELDNSLRNEFRRARRTSTVRKDKFSSRHHQDVLAGSIAY